MSRLRPAAVVVLASACAAQASSCLGVDAADSEPTTKKDAGGDPDSAGLADGSWACSPKSCKDLGANCGATSDGCNKVIECGSCASGETCGAAGPNVCGVGACTPTTCAAAGAECGLIGDGCGKSLDCGGCPSPKACGAGGAPNQCSCVAATCASLGKDCGTVSDGCGGNLSCGACPAGKKCGGGGTPNVCACEPTTCAAQGKNCGTLPDGCGASLDCGTCKAPKTCGGLGTANVCGCSPADCPPIYKNSFEATSDFPAGGWQSWQNCPTDGTWSASREQYPAPGGGSWGLRLHTTGFVGGCQYPGVYAQTPPISALPGRQYRVTSWSRNASNIGQTALIFYDAADQQIDAQFGAWTPDSWAWNADPPLTGTSPANAKWLRIRYALQSPSEYADLDLLEVHLEPL
ncbi:MAG: hypothetical protein IT377_18665 [Polyangiaceae bacterium]|nr:hypothetical protein [Polyangiaceae bacterium]